MEIETKESQLEVIVKESQLEPTKAQYILENFKNYFELAAEWEAKAKTLIVTDASQKAEMEMARTGRLFLREKRIAVENSRKKLKEQSLREGKAIDGIANVLKALIEPIEEHLERQEKFIEIKQKEKDDAHRAEVERRMEEERQEEERKAAAERERIRLENEQLRKENAEKDRIAAEERKKQDDILAEERRKNQEAQRKRDEEKRQQEEKARKEREAADEKRRKDKAAADKKLAAERAENERLAELLKNEIECPKCHHKFQNKKAK